MILDRLLMRPQHSTGRQVAEIQKKALFPLGPLLKPRLTPFHKVLMAMPLILRTTLPRMFLRHRREAKILNPHLLRILKQRPHLIVARKLLHGAANCNANQVVTLLTCSPR